MDLLLRRVASPAMVASLAFLMVGCPAFVNQAPISILDADPQTGEAPLDVQFDGSASFDADGTIVLFEWDFGDGSSTATGQSPSHKFETDGSFNVLLTVTDNFGSKDTGSIQIDVTSEKIYFSSDQTGDQEIFVMNTSGGNLSQVTSNVNTEIFPALVPNTRDRLAFSTDRNNPGLFFDIFSSNPDGSLPSNLTPQTSSNSIQPSWSPGGDFIAYADDQNGSFEIFIADSGGTLLTGGDPLISEGANLAIAPAWRPVLISSSGSMETYQVAYVRHDTGTLDSDILLVEFTIDTSATPPSISGVSTSNLVVDAANVDGGIGGPVFTLGTLPGSSTPSWNSDGSRLAFTREVGAGNLDIFTVASDGTDVKNVNAECFSGNASQAGSNEYDPYWLENDDVTFVSDRTGTDQVFIVDCSGSGVVTQLTTLGTLNVHPASTDD